MHVSRAERWGETSERRGRARAYGLFRMHRQNHELNKTNETNAAAGNQLVQSTTTKYFFSSSFLTTTAKLISDGTSGQVRLAPFLRMEYWTKTLSDLSIDPC